MFNTIYTKSYSKEHIAENHRKYLKEFNLRQGYYYYENNNVFFVYSCDGLKQKYRKI